MAKKQLDISKSIKRPGALTKKAKRAGMSPLAYARKMRKAPGLTGQQARFALLLNSFRKKSKKSK